MAVQIEALNKREGKNNFGFFLEQGLGKTGLDLACFAHDLANEKVDAHIVTAPNYLKSGWEDGVAEWGLDVPVLMWPSQATKSQQSAFVRGVEEVTKKKKPHLIVLNSEATISSGGNFIYDQIRESGLRYSATLDESSFIKGFNKPISKRTREIFTPCEIHRELCGTPMPQNVMDWYAQLRFLRELNGWNPYQFRNKFAVMGGYMGKVVKGVRDEAELHEILNRCSFRALKKDWWEDMPEKMYMPPLEFEMLPKQWKAYQEMLTDFYYEVKGDAALHEEDAIFANQVIHMKLKLQQISRGFIMDKDNDRVIELMPPKDNPALKVTKQWLEGTTGKVLIAAHYNYSVNMLEAALKDYGFLVMRGGMSTPEMKALKDQFNNDRSIKGMIGMDAVMARGHTLLGTEDMRCNNTLFFENSYNKEVRDQLEDRNHRWGQDRGVGYWDLFCCPEDKACVLALQQKQNLIDAVVNAVRSFPKVRVN